MSHTQALLEAAPLTPLRWLKDFELRGQAQLLAAVFLSVWFPSPDVNGFMHRAELKTHDYYEQKVVCFFLLRISHLSSWFELVKVIHVSSGRSE